VFRWLGCCTMWLMSLERNSSGNLSNRKFATTGTARIPVPSSCWLRYAVVCCEGFSIVTLVASLMLP
jgi:hypothetical protein